MLSPYRSQPNTTNKRTKKASNTYSDNNSHRDPDVKRPQMTSNDHKTIQTFIKSNKRNKSVLKRGSIQENTDFNDQCLVKFQLIMPYNCI